MTEDELLTLGEILARFIEKGSLDPWISIANERLAIDGEVKLEPHELELIGSLLGGQSGSPRPVSS